MAEPGPSQNFENIEHVEELHTGELKWDPVNLRCPHCGQVGKTQIEYVSGAMSWVTCLILLWFGLILGCFLLPFIVKGCKDCVHKCRFCGHVFGKYRRLSSMDVPS